jgi:hypothetical protein
MRVVDAFRKVVDALCLGGCVHELGLKVVDALRLSTLRFDIWGNKGEEV